MPSCLADFVFLVEMGFHNVSQAGGLELLISGDLSTLASQSAEIIGVSHCTKSPNLIKLILTFLLRSVIRKKNKRLRNAESGWV